MFIRYRSVRLKDLPECLGCIRDGFAYRSGEELSALGDFWRDLLSTRAGIGAVMEDLEATAGGRIVWFCLKVFITDDYARYLKAEAAPFVGREILRSWLKGNSPCLSAAQIRRGNSSTGVNILVLNWGTPDRMMSTKNQRTLSGHLVDFSRYFTAGYRCKEMLQEYYDDATCRWAHGAGYRLRTDYAHHVALATTDAGRRPMLYGVTAAEAAASAGTLASMLLNYEAPQFAFRPNEQQLLLEALLGETDENLAHSLDVALVTVRKRWEAIYEKVADIAPDLLGSVREPEGCARGAEKKRRLLNYLRQHPEELRPFDATVCPE